jgi:hypothetical protein
MTQSKDLLALVFEHHDDVLLQHNHDVLLQHTIIATPQEFFNLLKAATIGLDPAHTYPLIDADQSAAIKPAASILAKSPGLSLPLHGSAVGTST